jgi:hypothetical protein
VEQTMSEISKGEGWWEASDGKWHPPERHPSHPPSAAPRTSRGVTVALWATVIGWVILGFLAALSAFSGEETNCTAHRGAEYQSCVRSGDLNGLVAQAAVIGLSGLAVVVMLRRFSRHRDAGESDPRARYTAVAVAGLLIASSLSWIWGIQGGWAPSRPFPYEPVATSQANAFMMAGLLIGMAIGALFPLERRHR